MRTNKDKEYTTPTVASTRKDREIINAKTQAFLNSGGVVEMLPGDLAMTEAHKKTEAKRIAARKRGKEKMKGLAA
ncbi:MAG: hypothetical protein JKY50_07315 [Oleispira sp.]|nr:hypothetical protein [Oleispira sp.]MBL4881190.1 hypothetical protein [Oleispira sp.]